MKPNTDHLFVVAHLCRVDTDRLPGWDVVEAELVAEGWAKCQMTACGPGGARSAWLRLVPVAGPACSIR